MLFSPNLWSPVTWHAWVCLSVQTSFETESDLSVRQNTLYWGYSLDCLCSYNEISLSTREGLTMSVSGHRNMRVVAIMWQWTHRQPIGPSGSRFSHSSLLSLKWKSRKFQSYTDPQIPIQLTEQAAILMFYRNANSSYSLKIIVVKQWKTSIMATARWLMRGQERAAAAQLC